MRLTGDAKRDEEQIYSILAEFECNQGYEKRSLVVSEKQAKTELFAKLRCGELKAQGVKIDPFNKGQPVSDTFQNIPANDWAVLEIHLFRRNFGGRYVASYGHNWWRHIVCPSAVVRELWPAGAGSARPLSHREQVARIFLEDWFKSGKPRRGASSAAIRHVATACCAHCSNPFEAAKQSTRAFVAEEIARFCKAPSKTA